MKYLLLKRKHEVEINNLPIFFAFNDEQFKKAITKAGLTMDNYKGKLFKMNGGGFYKKTDSKLIMNTFDRHHRERKKAIELDTTGKGYIFQMFLYELNNHEFCITYDVTDTLESLGLTMLEVESNKFMMAALIRAKAKSLATSW